MKITKKLSFVSDKQKNLYDKLVAAYKSDISSNADMIVSPLIFSHQNEKGEWVKNDRFSGQIFNSQKSGEVIFIISGGNAKDIADNRVAALIIDSMSTYSFRSLAKEINK